MSELLSFTGAAKGLARNPLGIIALFIVLIYGFAALTLGINTHLESNDRTPLVWFLVLFPFAVLALFGWLVSSHHEKLYAPGDYRSDESFLKRREISERRTAELRAEQDALKARIHETILELSAEQGASKATVERVAVQITADIDRSTNITVDASKFLGDPSAVFTYPVAAFESLSDLTNEVYFKLAPKVRPFRYGQAWVLRNSQNNVIIKTLRMLARIAPGTPLNDPRSLSEVGISPGTALIVERVDG